jgi:hypothetical protein
MATNNQNEQENLQTIPEEELNGVTGGKIGWVDGEGNIHHGSRPSQTQGFA